MLLSQIAEPKEGVAVTVRDSPDARARIVNGASSLYALACEAIDKGTSLAAAIEAHSLGETVNLAAAHDQGRPLPPIHHPDPAHLHLTGTGLTHLGSASTRDAVHQKIDATAEETLTDSMKMFRIGLEGGKPAAGTVGVQPKWFYKGNGRMVAAPGAPLTVPAFGDNDGEKPEIAGVYVIGGEGTPFRVGFALSNEFSDHVMERVNYLYLAHSKLRPAAFGPEILVGGLPEDIQGRSRIRRGNEVVWEKPFLSGETNMSRIVANLEHHHFKYGLFRAPGDVHVHMFGTATLSFTDNVRAEVGDIFEIEAPGFGLPLRNALVRAGAEKIAIRAL